MKISSNIAALAIAGLLASTSLQAVSWAADSGTGATTAPKSDAVAQTTATINKDAQVLRTSDDLYRALREVRAARLAIFDGDSDTAKSMIDDVNKDLKAARMSASDFAVKNRKSGDNGDQYLPFDMSIGLAEGFQPTDEKVSKVKEANAHIANGDQKKAIETLKLANIDIVYNAALLPINVSVQHAADAAKLASDGSYYEANLALKAIEDSIIVDSYGAGFMPNQGES